MLMRLGTEGRQVYEEDFERHFLQVSAEFYKVRDLLLNIFLLLLFLDLCMLCTRNLYPNTLTNFKYIALCYLKLAQTSLLHFSWKVKSFLLKTVHLYIFGKLRQESTKNVKGRVTVWIPAQKMQLFK